MILTRTPTSARPKSWAIITSTLIRLLPPLHQWSLSPTPVCHRIWAWKTWVIKVKRSERVSVCHSDLESRTHPNIKIIFPGMGITNLKIRQSWDRLIFNMGTPIQVWQHLYIEMPPPEGTFILRCPPQKAPLYWDAPPPLLARGTKQGVSAEYKVWMTWSGTG